MRCAIPRAFLGALDPAPENHKIARNFSEALGRQQLLTVDWPVAAGGRNGSLWDLAILREEMWANFEPRGPQYVGAGWIGAAIMKFGTAHQKQQHLRPISN